MYKELDERLRSDSIDLMHVEGYYMLQHLAARPQVPTVLKEENIEFLLDRQRENLGFHDDAPWQIAEQLEREAWSRVDLCATISRDDLHRISTIAPDVPVALSPQGSDQAVVRPDDLERDGPVAATLFGCYSYPPTEDAAMHLLNEVWPLVLDALGEDLELRLVGTAPTPRMREAANGMPHVKIVGRVPAVADAYRGGDIALAPLRIGGGVKMKIVEAISHGCAVVATNLAAEGLPSPVRAALLLGDDPQTLARHIAALAADPALRRWRAQACLEASRVMPSWDEAAECLWSIWTHCMRGSEPALALNSGESNA
jgi:glycosyltransferase involved in cell wall biosynthesis